MHDEGSAGKPTLNALFISLDKNLLKQELGDARLRHLRYARHFNNLNIIVFTLKKDGFTEPKRIGNLHIIPTNSYSRWCYVIDAIKLGQEINKKEIIHIVSTQDPFVTAIAGILLKWMLRTKLNIQIHNDYGSSFWKNESLQNRVFSLMLPLTIRLADSIRAVSRLTAKIAPNQGKVFIAPIAIDTEFFKPKDEKKLFDIVCVARLDKQKNIPLLISTIARLKNNFPKIRALIIGEGSQRHLIQHLIDDQQLRKNVVLVGRKTREEVRDLLWKSKIFILPSNYEGWGLAAAEAAACGLPVVMTDTGGAREIVLDGKTGHIVTTGNEESLCNRIEELLEDDKKLQSMGEAARAQAERIALSREEFPKALLN